PAAGKHHHSQRCLDARASVGGVGGGGFMAADLSLATATRGRDDGRRSLQVAGRALCSTELPLGLMGPDGGPTCARRRRDFKDAKACSDRWTGREGKPRKRRSGSSLLPASSRSTISTRSGWALSAHSTSAGTPRRRAARPTTGWSMPSAWASPSSRAYV